MFKSVQDNDCEENGQEFSSLYDLFRDEISELGESSTDWWRERTDLKYQSTVNTKEIGSRSPVFKTPQLNTQTRKRKSWIGSCVSSSGEKRSRVTSPLGIEPLEFFSPFKTSRLSPITHAGGSVPESLEHLLQDGGEISWSSAFATPLTGSATCSNLNSEERKLFMPSSTSKNPRILFTSECEPVEQDYYHPTNTSDDKSQDSTTLFENTSASNKCDTLCYSTPCHKNVSSKTSIVNRTQDYSRKDLPVQNNEKEELKVSDDNHETDLQTSASSSSSRKERKLSRKCRKRSLVMSPDSGMNEFTNAEVDLVMSSSLLGEGSGISRKMVQEEAQDSNLANVQFEEDSGAVGSREVTNTKYSDSLQSKDCCKFSPLPTIEEIDSSVNGFSYSDLEKTEDFPHDLSLNTLEEVRQATEVLAANADSEVEFFDDRSRLCSQVFNGNKTHSLRTSTPIANVEKKSKIGFDSKKKKIKFVHEERTDTFEERKLRCNEQKHKNDSIPLLPVNENVTDCVSRIQIIKSAASQVRKFTYVPSVTSLKTAVDEKKGKEILIEDIVESAYTLESAKDSNEKSRCEVQDEEIMNLTKNTPRLVSFSKLQSFSHSTDSMRDPVPDNSNKRMVRFSGSDNHIVSDIRQNLNSSFADSESLQAATSSSSLTHISSGNVQNLTGKNIVTVERHGVEKESTFSIDLTQHYIVKQCESLPGKCTSSCDEIKIRMDDEVDGYKQNFDENKNLDKLKETSFDIEDYNNSVDVTGQTNKNYSLQNNDYLSVLDRIKEETYKHLKNIENVKNMNRLVNGSYDCVFDLMEAENDRENTMTDSQMVQVAEHAELLHQLSEDDNIFTQWQNGTAATKQRHDKQVHCKDKYSSVPDNIEKDVKNFEIIVEESSKTSAAMSIAYSQEVGKANKILQKLHSENVQKEISENLKHKVIRKGPRCTFQIKEAIDVKSGRKNNDDIEEILNTSVIKQLFNEETEKDFSEMSSLNVVITNSTNENTKSEKTPEKSFSDITVDSKLERNFLDVKETTPLKKSNVSEENILCSSEIIILGENEINANSLLPIKFEKENVPVIENTMLENKNEIPDHVDSSVKSNVFSAENEPNYNKECEREPLRMKNINKKNSPKLSENKLGIGRHHTPQRTVISEFKQQLFKSSFAGEKYNKINASGHVSLKNVSVLSKTLHEADLKLSEEASLIKTCSSEDEVGEIALNNYSRKHANMQKDNSFLNADIVNGITATVSSVEEIKTGHCVKGKAGVTSISNEIQIPVKEKVLEMKSDYLVDINMSQLKKVDEKTPEMDRTSKKTLFNSSEKCIHKTALCDTQFTSSLTEAREHSLASGQKSDISGSESESNLNRVKIQISKDATTNKYHKTNLDKLKDFSVASGEEKISEEALNNHEIDISEGNIGIEKNATYMKNTNTAMSEFKGFLNADVEKSVSEEAANNAKVVFSDQMFENNLSEGERNVFSAKKPSISGSEFPILAGVCEMKALVSEEAFNNVNIPFSEDVPDDKMDASLMRKPSTVNAPECQGFFTANGKKIPVSVEALEAVSLLFSEDTIENELPVYDISPGNPRKITLLSEVCSPVISKEISVAEDFNKNRFHISQTKFKNDLTTKLTAISAGKPVIKEDVKQQGFSSSKVKELSLSENSINRTKVMPEDIKFSKVYDEESKSLVNEQGIVDAEKYLNFIITDCSNSSLLKTSHKGNVPQIENSNNVNMLASGNDTMINTSEPKGFLTASGKKIIISEDSMNKVKMLFFEDEEFCAELPMSKSESNLQDVSSPSKKEIFVSQKVVDADKCMFLEEDTFDKELTVENALESISKPQEKISNSQSFSNAITREVTFTDDDLNRIKLSFSEEGKFDEKATIETSSSSTSKPTTKIQDYSTASGKQVSVSKEVLNRAKHLSSEEESFDEKVTVETALPSPGKPTAKFQGFSTASGKQVSVSKEALNRAKLLFSEEETFGEELTVETALPSPGKPRAKFQGFSTASDKQVSVSKEAMDRAKLLFSEVETFDKITEENALPSPGKPTAKFQGFSTASGKKVSVSKEAIDRAKLLFSEEETFNDKIIVETDLPFPGKPTAKFQGFSTASGKKVSVSKEAIDRAKLLFSEEETFDDNVTVETALPSPHKPTAKFQDFSTASGKQVSVSKEAMTRAKLLFSEEETFDDKVTVETALQCPGKPTAKFQGFSTASGKNVSVSKEALNRAKLLFSEEETFDQITEENALPSPGKATTKFQGFSTASGKNVSVSKEALNRAKFLFSEEESFGEKVTVETALPTPGKPTAKFQGFSTASGKQVSVSKEAVDRAKLLFSEEETFDQLTVENALPSPGKSTAKFQGFSTASGKQISVSDDALHAAKVLFSEDEFDVKFSDIVSQSKSRPNSDSSTFQCFSSTSSKDVPLAESVLNRETILFPKDRIKDKVSKCERDTAFAIKNNSSEVYSFENIKALKDSLSPEREKRAKNVYENLSIFQAVISDLKHANVISDKESTDFPKTSETLNKIKQDSSSDKNSPLSLSPVLKSSTCNKRVHISSIKHSRDRLSISRKSRNSNKLKFSLKHEDLNMNVPQRVKNYINTNMSSPSKDKSSILNFNHNVAGKCVKSVEGDVKGTHFDDEKCKKGTLLSLTQEVKECSEALLADEDTFDSSLWSYVSCPDMVYDHPSAPAALVCSEKAVTKALVANTHGSPVLSRGDRSKRKRRSKHSQSSSPNSSVQNSQKLGSSSFKVPYKNITTSGETLTPTHTTKRIGRQLDFSTPFAKRLRVADSRELEVTCRNKCMGKKDVCADVVAGRQASAEAQNALIKSKLSMGVTSRPCKGSYYLRKLERHSQRGWRDMMEGEVPGSYTRKELLAFDVKESTTCVTSENAVEFRFSAWDHYSESVCHENVSGILVGDGALLILDAKGTAGVEEVTRALLSSLGVEPALVPAGWVTNHYRWLVWKLAATECSFPQQFAARCLTPNMLLLQLKYRYDIEIDDCRRPAIRKILEHDDSPAKRLVLCVSRIIKLDSVGDPQYELELTDGWYGITATVDQELMQHIHRGTITIGTKLISYGAELVNCNQGCSPLEVGSEVRLKLFSNSTRRARWDAKLGYCRHPGPLTISLSSVLPTGGMVSSVAVTVVRVYPVLYVEKHEDGKSVFRSVRAEERANALWEKKQQEYIELLCSQMRKELSQEDAENKQVKPKHITNAQELSVIFSGDRLARIIELAPDPASVEALLNEEQKTAVTKYQREKNERLQQELQTRVQEKLREKASGSRSVVELLKVRCVDPNIPMSTKSAVLSIWRPSEDMPQLLKEGNTLKLFNVQTAGFRSGDLQLSAGRQTSYKPIPHCQCDFYKRRVTSLSEAMSSDFHPPFGELDIVGMVIYLSPSPRENSGFQTVYLADSDFSILGVAFWGGVKRFCWEEVLKPRTLVAASNLQWRHGAAVRWVPCAYVSELSVFSAHPRQSHLQEALTAFSRKVEQQGLESFHATCVEKINKLLQGDISPMSGLIPRRSALLGTSDSLHVGSTTLDFRTPPNKKESVNSPGNILQRVNTYKLPGAVQEFHLNCSSILEYGESPLDRRLDKLRQYGDGPPLPMDIVIPVLPTVRRPFNVPKKIDSPAESPPLSLDSDPG